MKRERDEESGSGLGARLMAAVIAPLFFCVPLGVGLLFLFIIVGLGGAGRRRVRWLPEVFGHELGHALAAVVLVAVVVPAVVGFCLGPTRFPTFLGHCFFTNGKDERSWPVTVAIWLVAFALAAVLYVSM